MKHIKSIMMALSLIAGLSSCTPKMTFRNSTIVPSASGTVQVKTDKNKNYVLNIDVQNLAPPKNLTPSKNTYLVWMTSNESSTKKLGQLNPSGKVLKATLSATSVDKPQEVFVTAEDNVDIQFPDGPTILTTK
ncbi:hypothetical protein [Spirosoma oryzicola]|uniref:hypothetical protein n=1 Tax=Spirosoma oryzicola TaxID=2898794 RepID=UPI001E4CF46C|nr:hypothetical protein [Spirosoma oryzicola]UHG94279.1 hypothetical protein LQ777_26450 [Spirosoma oryzicola]